MSLNALKVLKGISKVPSVFLSGVAFGTLGLKLLTSKEAKKGYANVLPKPTRLKTVSTAWFLPSSNMRTT